jgi:hypothetical protein
VNADVFLFAGLFDPDGVFHSTPSANTTGVTWPSTLPHESMSEAPIQGVTEDSRLPAFAPGKA